MRAESSADLARLLAEGPFPDALRAAIDASGLSLDRVRHRLGQRGVSVSVPTLSLWQSGRRRPARPESLRALAHLDQVLGLPPGSLTALLGPRDRDGVTHLSQQDRVEVDGRLLVAHSRTVLRGGRADRWQASWELGEGPPPAIEARRNCRVGRVEHDFDRGTATAELVLDEPIEEGASVILEYVAVFDDPTSGRYLRLLDRTARDYLLEASFATPPRVCVREPDARALTPDPTGAVHFVAADVTGRVGIRWAH
ncbi:hypothetical protein [Actinosynnema sp. NPDC020468]|uniref:hypothetical protein n=1 Tax=Actinosynnema sp. NPDC020468 TaxID=3154488 RepID=UPI0033D2DA64